MARKYAEIAFTPSVKAAQERYGSRAANRGHEMAEDRPDVLGATETAFIQARDGFYQATVSETGWPYVQFRGGPAGFLKVLDERTIGYADFRGNIQYLSVGNLTANDRIALILMDYPNRRRLKVWARARIVHRSEDPDLLDRLEVPIYRARVERAVVLTVEALDWNCPQHITPRFTESEVEELVRPLTDRIAELEAATPGSLPARSEQKTALGDGPLDLIVTGIRQLTPEVRAYELRRPDSGDLPPVGAGSHILIPVPSENGRQESRAYSISSSPSRRDAYEIAVRLDPDGRGGSRAIHAGYTLGTRLRASRPRNTFTLHRNDRPAVLIAGGIGITPLKAMAHALKADGRPFHLHYAARSGALMAYRPELAGALEGAVSFYDTAADQRIDIEAVLSNAALDAIIYVCGPSRLIDAVRRTAFALGIAPARVVHESFGAAPNPDTDTAFEVHLERSGTTLQVAADKSILDTLIDAGVATDFECRSGTCGTCATKVLEGEPLHRDSALTDAERDQAGLICTCVSRAASDRLVLDL
jgi:ferredoxin-NADP reductase/predicted pyridoxine 5'-phosphate oxidase superfamily flavin-nucleotide-binding protein